MLKTHANPADKDNLLSYLSTDRVMRAQAEKMNATQDQSDDDQAQLERARLMSSPEFKAMKKQMRVQSSNGTTRPASDDVILQQLMLRRAARKKVEEHQ